MKIIVFIKQVPDTNEVKIDPKKGTLIRDGVPSIINPDDKHAIEAAITLKEQHGAETIVVTMGPPQADVALREALAMGIDKAYLLTDRAFAGADTWATSLTLAAAVNALGGADIILCGHQAIDGDTAQTGPSMAEKLDIAQITGAVDIEVCGEDVCVQRETEEGVETVLAKLPVLITATKALNKPRYATVAGIVNAYDAEIVKLSAADINIDPDEVGTNGSPTSVARTFTPAPKGKGRMVEGSAAEAVAQIARELDEKNIWKAAK
ncbi:MAG: electron transfer flavoprotein subunit beta/FixA family protein [Christensenellaceae bacterium]|nr:electron transfer flavoprotein subunit beta/FixA family protein [Christensenellaceae bacterium]